MNRRSFLAAVMGAIGAKAMPIPDVPKTPDIDAIIERMCRPSRYFTVIDSLMIIPGTVVDCTLFPPPSPKKFVIQRIDMSGVEFETLRQMDTEFRIGEELLMKAGAWQFSRCPLASPVTFGEGDWFSLHFDSSGREIAGDHPVELFVAVSGIVEVGPGG